MASNPLREAPEERDDDDSHETAPSQRDRTESGDEDDDDEEEEDEDYSDSNDPRLSLATTATMTTAISEGVNDGRGRVVLVRGAARVLLPRSSRTAVGCTALLALLAVLAAAAASLSIVDTFYTDVGDALEAAHKGLQVADAAAAATGATASFALAALLPADRTLRDQFTTAAERTISGAAAVALARGQGDRTVSDSAARDAQWWAEARARVSPAASVAAPQLSSDIAECVREATAAAEADLHDLAAARSSAVAAAAGFIPAAHDALVAALAGVAELAPRLAAVSDADLAAAAVSSGASANATKTAIADTARRAGARLASTVAVLHVTMAPGGGGALGAAARLPAVEAAAPAKRVAALLASGAYVDAGTDAALDADGVRVAAAAARWATEAAAALRALNTSLGDMHRAGAAAVGNEGVAALAAAATRAMDAAERWRAASATALEDPTVTLARWAAGTAEQRAAAFPFNRTLFAALARRGLADPATSPVAWIRGRTATSRADVAAALGLPPPPAALPATTPCSGESLHAAGAELAASALWLANAVADVVGTVDRADLLERHGASKRGRDGLVATLVVCVAAIAVVALYGQWGVAARLSASPLPYGSFVKGWWGVALVAMLAVAWATGVGFYELLDDDVRAVPRFAAASGSATADARGMAEDAARVWNATSLYASADAVDAAEATPANRSLPPVLEAVRRGVALPLANYALLASDELVGSAEMRWALGGGDALNASARAASVAPFGAPSLLNSRDTASVPADRAVSCGLALAMRAAGLASALSLPVALERDVSSSSSGGVRLTAAAAAVALARAPSLRDSLARGREFAVGDAAYHAVVCSTAAGAAADDAARLVAVIAERADATTLAERRVNLLASYADAPAAAPVTLLDLAPLAATAAQQVAPTIAPAYAATVADAWAAATALRGNLQAAVVESAVSVQRHVVWGCIGACLVAEIAIALIWRMLFGATWTPF